jgi:hypothetical protein
MVYDIRPNPSPVMKMPSPVLLDMKPLPVGF